MDQFYNSENFSVAQRKESFNRWISNPASQQNCDDILSKLNAQNNHERIFYVEALIYFKKTNILYEILKEGNQLFTTRIVKEKWFLEEAFQNLSAEDLVNKILPYLSFIVRKKCLKKLSLCWPQEKVDALYDAIHNRYGLTAAIPILHKCSLVKLEAVLKENEIKLRPNQIIQLFENNEDMFKLYIDYHKTVLQSMYSEKKVIDYIALKKPALLLELQKLGKLKVGTLGRRTTKRVIPLKIESLHEDGNKYIDIFNKQVMVKKLGHKFPIVFNQMIPNGFPQVSAGSIQFPDSNTHKYKNLLNKYPKKLRWLLFHHIYFGKFPNNTEENLLLGSSADLIRLLCPPPNVVLKWAKLKYEIEEENSYLQFFPSEEYIRMMKKTIASTKVSRRREEHLFFLIDCCGETKDLNALEEVLKYLVDEHKLERSTLLSQLISAVTRKFKPDTLQEKHWEYINKLWKIIAVSDDYSMYNSREYGYYLQFLFKSGKCHKQAINDLIHAVFKSNFWHLIDIEDESTEKEIYTEFCKQLSEVNLEQYTEWCEKFCYGIALIIRLCLKSPKKSPIDLRQCQVLQKYVDSVLEKRELNRYTAELLGLVAMYNQTFPEYALNTDNAALLDLCIQCITSDEYKWYVGEMLSSIVNKKDRDTFANELLVQFLTVLYKDCSNSNVMNWLLKHEPKTLMPYIDSILIHCFEAPLNYEFDNKILKLYSHVGLVEKVKNCFFKINAELGDGDTNKISSFLLMVYPLFTPDEIISIVEQKFVPQEEKLNLNDKEMCDKYKGKCDIAKILGDFDEAYKMLPTIMKFVRGDYLQSALPALYKAFYKSPERLLYSYVHQLAKQAVSAKKHALHLSCAVLNNEQVVNMLQTTKNVNVSSQKYFFTAMSKYFVKNPSEVVFDKFIENLKSVGKYDSETLNSLISLSVPKKYKSKYIECCWYFIEGLELAQSKKKEYLDGFLSYITKFSINSLSWELVTYIINKYFVKEAPISLGNINNFVIKALNDVDQIKLFNLVLDILITLNRNSTYSFFNAFITSAVEKTINRKCVDTFSELWCNKFDRVEHLQSHIVLKLLKLILDYHYVDDFARSIFEYMEQLISELGPLVLDIFREQVTDILKHIPDIDLPTFYSKILVCKTDVNTCVFVLEALQNSDKTKPIDLVEYDEVIQILKNVDIPIVIALFNSWIVSHM
ncbi:uncharacterized protein LOC126893274 [Diabrotica virgifera virgifera]|uniref:Uncharacterized protein n=1 Tax=Diabrotica virgifera virgifera TaxID=50390 RepID=A0ABM5L9X8_DIAVI|nr:uncharacterized protein LOC126893274 [Diabrotica virgifera virgifera]XP_050519245.1 uncharacterized protein LOC126893274 [Diabrotica virgifera virgifera]XP_050519246.1 uncharacterized protein LOC126893274 [Diabrotica virgifera virgifera]